MRMADPQLVIRTLMALWSVLCGMASSADPYPGDATLDRRVHAYLDSYARHGLFSGVVLIARNGKPIVRRAYGYADWVKRVPNTPETRFRIFSMTKSFTAAAVMIVQERKLLNTGDPVGKHLEGWPDAWKSVKIHHLLTHSSGIDVDQAFAWWVEHYPEKARISQHPGKNVPLKNPKLRFEPGKQFEYSNPGFLLLSEIIAKVSGKSYRDFLQEAIFQPLGMKDSDAWQAGAEEQRAHGYFLIGSAPTPGEQGTGYIVGAGDIYTTADDLLKFDQALYTNKLLTERSRKSMFTPHTKEDYGYGWFVGNDEDGRCYSHTGGGAGFTSAFYRHPDAKLTVIVLCNHTLGDDATFFRDVERLTAEWDVSSAPYLDIPPDKLKGCVGRYAFRGTKQTTDSSGIITAGRFSGEIVLTALTKDGMPPVSFIAIKPNRFRNGQIELEFKPNRNHPRLAVLHFGKRSVPLVRVP